MSYYHNIIKQRKQDGPVIQYNVYTWQLYMLAFSHSRSESASAIKTSSKEPVKYLMIVVSIIFSNPESWVQLCILYSTKFCWMGKILTNLTNSLQFMIVPFKVFISNGCLHVRLTQFVKILLINFS